ncbi:hypothetical protein D3C87_513580 [compost metagenome]
MKKVIFENLEVTNDGSYITVSGTFKTDGSATNEDVFSTVQGILREVSKITTHGGEHITINGNKVVGQVKLI